MRDRDITTDGSPRWGQLGPPLNLGKRKFGNRNLPERLRTLACNCSNDLYQVPALGGAFRHRRHVAKCPREWAFRIFFRLRRWGTTVGPIYVYSRVPESPWREFYFRVRRSDSRLAWNLTYRIRMGDEYLLLAPFKADSEDGEFGGTGAVLNDGDLAELLVRSAQAGLDGRMVECLGSVTAKSLSSCNNKGEVYYSQLCARLIQEIMTEHQAAEDLLTHVGLGSDDFDDDGYELVKADFLETVENFARRYLNDLKQDASYAEAKQELAALWADFKLVKEGEAARRRWLLGVPDLPRTPPFALPPRVSDSMTQFRENQDRKRWSLAQVIEADIALEIYTPAAKRYHKALEAVPAPYRRFLIENKPIVREFLESDANRGEAAWKVTERLESFEVRVSRCKTPEDWEGFVAWCLEPAWYGGMNEDLIIKRGGGWK